jgi:hypothetical protein
MSRRFAAPRRGVRVPPGQELLGVVTSHGPFRESYNPSRKSTSSAKAFDTPAADAALSAERMRAAFSSPASAPALLQRALPGGGAAMVAVEGAATIPGDGGGQAETEWPKPALPRAGPQPETPRARGSWRGREGNHSELFSSLVATGQAATRDSCASGAVPCNASARRRAGMRWSGCKSGSGAGKRRAT